jgi:hypothetical protein
VRVVVAAERRMELLRALKGHSLRPWLIVIVLNRWWWLGDLGDFNRERSGHGVEREEQVHPLMTWLSRNSAPRLCFTVCQTMRYSTIRRNMMINLAPSTTRLYCRDFIHHQLLLSSADSLQERGRRAQTFPRRGTCHSLACRAALCYLSIEDDRP